MSGLSSFALRDGVRIGETSHKDVELGELTAGDVIDANTEAEQVKVIQINGVPEATVIVSPSLAGIHTLRRQIKKLGELKGPIAYDVIRKLSAHDFDMLMKEAEKISGAVAKEAESRGRGSA